MRVGGLPELAGREDPPARRRRVEVRSLPSVPYADGLELQRSLREEVAAGRLPSQLLLLEHPHVITMGIRGGTAHLLVGLDHLEALGVTFVETDRGGDITYHGPGQLVGYPILDLRPDRMDVRRYVRDLEEVLIRTCGDLGVVGATRMEGAPGVWVGNAKVAAIGVRIKGWVTTHGFALNVTTDLSFFRLIVPCGLSDASVTSVAALTGRRVHRQEAEAALLHRFGEVFGAEVVIPVSSLADTSRA